MSDEVIEIQVSDGVRSIRIKGTCSVIESQLIKKSVIGNLLLSVANYSELQESDKQKIDIRPNISDSDYRSKIDLSESSVDLSEEVSQHQKYGPSHDIYGHMEDVAKIDIASREIEWILLYCYYASEFGKADFNRDDIHNYYDTSHRTTQSRKRNLSNNLQTLQKYGWIKASATKYSITDEGISRAKGILDREGSQVKTYN